jgi:hypothetical protein
MLGTILGLHKLTTPGIEIYMGCHNPAWRVLEVDFKRKVKISGILLKP